MDGFLDTMDAIHSYGDRSRKLEILKDPHLGAFAVISFGVYMMLYLGVFHEYLSLVLREDRGDRYFLYAVPCLVFVMERAFSGLSVVTFPQAKKKGLAAGFGGAARKRTDSLVLLLWMLMCQAAGAAAAKVGCHGAGMLAGVLLMTHLAVFIWYYRMSVKQFGGVTGDLAGCFLQVCELARPGSGRSPFKSGLDGRNVGMILVTGGSFQGKRVFVRQYLGNRMQMELSGQREQRPPGRNLWTAGSAVISSSLSGG